ncbi:MAG: thioredoxin domain-containing protein [Herbiconiux sp.]|nr:thioredoxin domain-containing protein [Herbiconiux sp.]
MAGKGKAEARAAERAERLEVLKKQAKAQERRRNLMVGGVVAVVLIIVGGVFFLVSQNKNVDTDDKTTEAGQSDYGLALGSKDAPDKLVIYEDFLCPICGEYEATTSDKIAELVAADKLYVDYRPFTLLDRFGPYSADAASAFGVVLDTSGPEVAKKFHDLLYDDQPAEDATDFPGADWLLQKAVEAGATEADVKAGIEAGENDFAKNATKEAFAAGVQGTPTVILNGELFNGGPDALLEELEK